MKGDFDNAEEEMKRVIALNPRNVAAYHSLGMIYTQQKLPSKAEEIFAQLLKIDADSADGHGAG